jgi:hypothetical protein
LWTAKDGKFGQNVAGILSSSSRDKPRVGPWEIKPSCCYHHILYQLNLLLFKHWKLACCGACLPFILLWDRKKQSRPFYFLRCGPLWCIGYESHKCGKNICMKIQMIKHMFCNTHVLINASLSCQGSLQGQLWTLVVLSQCIRKEHVLPSPVGRKEVETLMLDSINPWWGVCSALSL